MNFLYFEEKNRFSTFTMFFGNIYNVFRQIGRFFNMKNYIILEKFRNNIIKFEKYMVFYSLIKN